MRRRGAAMGLRAGAELELCDCEKATGSPDGLSCGKEGWLLQLRARGLLGAGSPWTRFRPFTWLNGFAYVRPVLQAHVSLPAPSGMLSGSCRHPVSPDTSPSAGFQCCSGVLSPEPS